MQELLLYCLLPVAAASGWLGARKHYIAKAASSEMDSLRRACRGGMDILLRDSPDKAVELISGALSSSADSFSAHMALAALARKEGLVEKAIALHQNLLAKNGLAEVERGQIRFELGMDFLRAGLFDRAEDIFTSLLALPAQREIALTQLLDIYQQEKDWPKAMECLRGMGGCGRRGESLAQFHCEVALAAWTTGNAMEAQAHVAAALEQAADCVRASLIATELALASADYALAYRCLKRVAEQNPVYLSEIFPYFLAHGERLTERRELLDYLDWIGAKYNSAEAAMTLAVLISRSEGLDKAVDYLSATVAARPTLRGLHALLGLLCEMPAPFPHLFVVRQSLQRFMLSSPSYHCRQCGFSAEVLYWRCPACRHWETMRLRHDAPCVFE